jgi:hypothetical protein
MLGVHNSSPKVFGSRGAFLGIHKSKFLWSVIRNLSRSRSLDQRTVEAPSLGGFIYAPYAKKGIELFATRKKPKARGLALNRRVAQNC